MHSSDRVLEQAVRAPPQGNKRRRGRSLKDLQVKVMDACRAVGLHAFRVSCSSSLENTTPPLRDGSVDSLLRIGSMNVWFCDISEGRAFWFLLRDSLRPPHSAAVTPTTWLWRTEHLSDAPGGERCTVVSFPARLAAIVTRQLRKTERELYKEAMEVEAELLADFDATPPPHAAHSRRKGSVRAAQ